MGTNRTIHEQELPKKARSMHQWIRLSLSLILLFSATLYIGRILQGESTNLQAAFESLSFQRIGAGLILATLTLACPTIYHVLVVERLSPARGFRRRIAAAYSLSQLVRYVPGKIFGVLFEVNYLRGAVNANVLVLSNLVQMVYQYAVSALFALLGMSVFFGGSAWFWCLSATAVAVVFFAHREAWGERTLLWLARRTPGLSSLITASVNRNHAPLASTIWLTMDWMFFIGVWYVIDLGTFNVTPYALLAACYAIASVLGTLAIVVPSGLLVREGFFIWLAHLIGFDPIALVTYAVLIRIWLTAGDLLTALLFGLLDRLRRPA